MFVLFVPWEKSYKHVGCGLFLPSGVWRPHASGIHVDQYLPFNCLCLTNKKMNLLVINTKVMTYDLSVLKLRDLEFSFSRIFQSMCSKNR